MQSTKEIWVVDRRVDSNVLYMPIQLPLAPYSQVHVVDFCI